MTAEPELNHINDDDSLPATRDDVRAAVSELAQTTNNAMTNIEHRMDRMDQKLDVFKNEILHHFDVVAENIHQDVAGIRDR